MNRLTIAIPTYKRNVELIRCLNSIKANTNCYRLDVVVSDNNPNNNLNINHYNEFFKLTYSQNEKNLGMMRNLLNLLTNIRGDYVLIITDDDYFLPGAIDKILAFIDSFDNENISAFKIGLVTNYIKWNRFEINNYGINKDINLRNEYQFKIFESSHILSGCIFKTADLPLEVFQSNVDVFYYPTALLFGKLIGKLEYMNEVLIVHTWENEVFWDFGMPNSDIVDNNWIEMCYYIKNETYGYDDLFEVCINKVKHRIFERNDVQNKFIYQPRVIILKTILRILVYIRNKVEFLRKKVNQKLY